MWAAQTKVERARWIAFMLLRQQVEAFHIEEKNLKKLNVTLAEWPGWDAETRDMKLEHAGTLKD